MLHVRLLKSVQREGAGGMKQPASMPTHTHTHTHTHTAVEEFPSFSNIFFLHLLFLFLSFFASLSIPSFLFLSHVPSLVKQFMKQSFHCFLWVLSWPPEVKI